MYMYIRQGDDTIRRARNETKRNEERWRKKKWKWKEMRIEMRIEIGNYRLVYYVSRLGKALPFVLFVLFVHLLATLV